MKKIEMTSSEMLDMLFDDGYEDLFLELFKAQFGGTITYDIEGGQYTWTTPIK